MRAQRSDARQNFDTLIAVADAAFTGEGAEVSLHEIARRAGVGIGTLYRHFPTRNDLIARVLQDSHKVLVARANELMTHPSPIEGLTTWLEALAEHGRTYSGLSEALGAALRRDGSLLCKSCDEFCLLTTRLVDRAKAAGEIGPDVQPNDVVMTAHAAAWSADQSGDPGAAKRMIAMVVAGMRTPAKPKRARR